MTTSLYRNPSEVPKSSPLVITQGTFDGVHLGHQKVLKHVVDLAKEQNTQSLLITYHPHPRLVVEPNNRELRMLSSIEEKSEAKHKVIYTKFFQFLFSKFSFLLALRSES